MPDKGDVAVPLEVVQREVDSHPILQSMIARGKPLTRNSYIAQTYAGDIPDDDDWNAEHEMELPKCFQHNDWKPGKELPD